MESKQLFTVLVRDGNGETLPTAWNTFLRLWSILQFFLAGCEDELGDDELWISKQNDLETLPTMDFHRTISFLMKIYLNNFNSKCSYLNPCTQVARWIRRWWYLQMYDLAYSLLHSFDWMNSMETVQFDFLTIFCPEETMILDSKKIRSWYSTHE